MSRIEWLILIAIVGILMYVVFAAQGCGSKLDEYKANVQTENEQWDRYAAKYDCNVTASYFGMIEKWVCNNDKIYWR